MTTHQGIPNGSLRWLEGRTIAFLGDSITAERRWGYVPLVVEKLGAQVDPVQVSIVNDGIDSSNILDVIDRLPDVLIEHDPDIVVLFVGVNDSKVLRYVDAPLLDSPGFERAYDICLRRIDVPRHRHKVLLTLPPLLVDRVLTSELLREYWYWREAEYRTYSDVIRRIAVTHAAVVADIQKEFASYSDIDRLFDDDGVHPSSVGHQLIANSVVEALCRLDYKSKSP